MLFDDAGAVNLGLVSGVSAVAAALVAVAAFLRGHLRDLRRDIQEQILHSAADRDTLPVDDGRSHRTGND